MPADPNIYRGVEPIPILSPQQYEAQRMDQQLAVDARRQKLQASQDDQAVRGVLSKYAGDPEGALTELQRVSPTAALSYQKVLTEQRKSALDQTKAELDIQKQRTEQGLQLMARAKTFKNIGMYRAAVNLLAMDDEDKAAFPQQLPDDATFDKLLGLGLTAKEQAAQNETALGHYIKGDLQKGLGQALIAAGTDPDAWTEAIQAGVQMGVPKALAQSLAQPTPENVERAKSLIGKSETEQSYTLGPGMKRFDASGKMIAEVPAAPGAAGGFTLAPGGRRYDAQGNVIASAPERPATGGGAKPTQREQDVDALAQTVIANPALFDQLTPTDKGRIAPKLQALGFDGFGKPLPAAAVKQISDTKTAIDSLNDLKAILKENEQYIGPIAGLQAMNPYSDARKAQARIDLVRQRVGKALEGGVLRKEDEEKYKMILATLRDTPETAIYKVDSLIHSLDQDISNFIGQQRLSGRRVSKEQEGAATGKKADPLGIR